MVVLLSLILFNGGGMPKERKGKKANGKSETNEGENARVSDDRTALDPPRYRADRPKRLSLADLGMFDSFSRGKGGR